MARSQTWQQKLAHKEKMRQLKLAKGDQGSRRLATHNGMVNTGTPEEMELAARREKAAAKRIEEGKRPTVPRSDVYLDCRVETQHARPLPRMYDKRAACITTLAAPRNRAQRRAAKFGLANAGWV